MTSSKFDESQCFIFKRFRYKALGNGPPMRRLPGYPPSARAVSVLVVYCNMMVYLAKNPPSTWRLCPVTMSDAPEAKKMTAPTRSVGTRTRPMGMSWI